MYAVRSSHGKIYGRRDGGVPEIVLETRRQQTQERELGFAWMHVAEKVMPP
jgi:hypothetical protein